MNKKLHNLQILKKSIILFGVLLSGFSTGFSEIAGQRDKASLIGLGLKPAMAFVRNSDKMLKANKILNRASHRDGSLSFPTYRIERKAYKDHQTQQIEIPEGVTFIDKMAFADCPNLTDVSFPSTVQDIENSFVNCAKLSDIDLSSASQLQSLVGSFKGCTNLSHVSLPENLEEIGASTFEGCSI